MSNSSSNSISKSFGSEILDRLVMRLKNTPDPRRRYEYLLSLGKKLPPMSQDLLTDEIKVKGCISQVYVKAKLINGKLHWQGFSDALITKGLLALLIQSLNELTPEEVMNINPEFIKETGLNSSLTPSRANGFLNILSLMKSQANEIAKNKSLLKNKS